MVVNVPKKLTFFYILPPDTAEFSTKFPFSHSLQQIIN